MVHSSEIPVNSLARHAWKNSARVIFLIMLFAVTVFTSCENKRSEIDALKTGSIGVETAKNVTIIYAIGDKTKSKITAPVMLRHVENNPFIEFPHRIHADFFDDSLQVESRLNARYAKYNENESKVFLRDSVVVIFNYLGDTLFCQELFWDRMKTGHEFYTDKPVRIRTSTQIIDGDGLDASQDFKSRHVVNARGYVRVPDEEFPE